jgi:hypothetical protein
VNCRWNEEKVFPSPGVLEVLEEKYVEARLHTDGPNGEALTELEQKLASSIATPLYLVLDPRTEQRLAGPVGGIVKASSFREFLLKALQGPNGGQERVGRLEER